MEHGSSILMFIFAGALLLYAGLMAVTKDYNLLPLRARVSVKPKDKKAYTFQLAKVIALVAAAPALGGLAGLLLLRKAGWRKLHEDVLVLLLYSVLTLLGMQAGRGLVSLVFGTAPATALGFITTDAGSYIFTAVILWIAARLDGMLEEQQHYLNRMNAKQEGEY